MYCFPLPIPHLVMSSRQTIKGDLELHVLTPFGQLDITFFITLPVGDGMPCFDIRVDGDTSAWMLDGGLPPSFHKTIIGFVGRIALRHSELPEIIPCELNIRFVNHSQDIHLSGHLMPYASAIADG